MNILSEVFSFASAVLFLGSFFPYIIAIIKKQIQPTTASWLAWALIDGITVLALYEKEILNVVAVLAVVGSSVIALLSLFLGKKGWSGFDKGCFALAFLSIVLWIFSKEPLWGVVLSQIAGLIAAVPTFLSTYEDPARESKLGWTMNWISCIALVLSLALIPQQGTAIWVQPIFFVLIQSTEMILLYRKIK